MHLINLSFKTSTQRIHKTITMLTPLLSVAFAAGWVNLTVFHVNSYHMGAYPFNMNVADQAGDMYFDLRSAVAPLECREDPTGHDCVNPEVTADDLVVTQLVLEVDENMYGQYGRCNVCANGTDHHGDNNCTDGTYVCTCSSDFHVHEDCGNTVGASNISIDHNRTCSAGDPDWRCWQDAAGIKLGGMWYSTTTEGYCGSAQSQNCSWRVAEVVKVVNKTCSDDIIYSTVESNNEACFQSCGARNTSSTCWITCFYNTLLGPEAGQPGGQVAGMPVASLNAAWNLPFGSACPSLPPVYPPKKFV